MPQHGQLARVAAEATEVIDDRVDDLVRHGVLLVEQDAEEEAVGARVVHVGQLGDGGGRVQDRHRHLDEHARDDGGLAQGAGAGRAEREEDALEEGGWLAERDLERAVRVHAQLARLGDLVAHALEQHGAVEALAAARVELRGEDARRGQDGVRRPRLRLRDVHERGPVWQRWQDLERLGQRS